MQQDNLVTHTTVKFMHNLYALFYVVNSSELFILKIKNLPSNNETSIDFILRQGDSI